MPFYDPAVGFFYNKEELKRKFFNIYFKELDEILSERLKIKALSCQDFLRVLADIFLELYKPMNYKNILNGTLFVKFQFINGMATIILTRFARNSFRKSRYKVYIERYCSLICTTLKRGMICQS